MNEQPLIQAVLFDLDGTLVDTAPDLAAALNYVRAEQGLPPLPLAQIRPYASHGARGLLKCGLNLTPTDERYPALQRQFLDYYASHLCVGTYLFQGIELMLAALEARQLKWGIVTNKVQRFALPLLAHLGLLNRAHCVVSGDSAPRAKPAPDPLLLASCILNTPPEASLYVGDDLRDVQSALQAKMRPIVATYGYLGGDTPYEEWGADALIDSPEGLLAYL